MKKGVEIAKKCVYGSLKAELDTSFSYLHVFFHSFNLFFYFSYIIGFNLSLLRPKKCEVPNHFVAGDFFIIDCCTSSTFNYSSALKPEIAPKVHSFVFLTLFCCQFGLNWYKIIKKYFKKI